MNEQRANEELDIELEYERVKEQRYKAFQEWLNECPLELLIIRTTQMNL